ncbi:MAG: cytochrome b/b6 domain-containing protein [Rubrivivax sp.]|nr:cytochrome b/b6 domain-containing protein [Rubrivivax sp.]
MTTTSASPADALSGSPVLSDPEPTLVWDLPVRVFHGMMVGCFALAWLTAESERWRLLHVSLGYGLLALIVFRLLWGVIGTRHARFSSFVRGPSAVRHYLGSLIGPKPEHHIGHNPAGGWAILAMLGLGALVAATGWAGYQDLAGEWLTEVHEGAATAMLAVAMLHVAGVMLSSWLHRENLVKAMFTGRKACARSEGIGSSRRWMGLLLAAGVIAVILGSWSGQASPDAGSPPVAEKRTSGDDDD